jgi:hypothetical protein
MFSNRCLKFCTVFLIALLPVLMTGCKKSPSGKFADDNGMMSMDLDSGKATVTVGGQSKTGDYAINDNKVTVKLSEGGKSDSMDFTYDPKDETLNGPMGMKLKKK